MPTTVISAFNEFLTEKVNLDPEDAKKARTSRDWLIKTILSFDGNVLDFPELYSQKNIASGSFARKTKIRELDDIDLMICLMANGSTYTEYAGQVEITVPEDYKPLSKCCNANSNMLNSRMVINKFVSALTDVSNYKKAEIHRDGEAATLKLTSYTWNFDVVPCFFTSPAADGRTYYIIPDGNGRWKKTDPRVDRDTLTDVNQSNNGNVLDSIRTMKYWNSRATAPKVPSYQFETMLVTHYINETKFDRKVHEHVDMEAVKILKYIAENITKEVQDIKGIQGNLNKMSYDECLKVQQIAVRDYDTAVQARNAEDDNQHQISINRWANIFGPGFPSFE